MRTWETNSPEETFEVGKDIASLLCPGDVLLLKGDLGAGKTTLSKSIIHSLTGIQQELIDSPTYTYVNEYDDMVYHFDLYRLENPEAFYRLGLDDYFSHNGICIIEWPEKCEGVFPSNARIVALTHNKTNSRTIVLEDK